MRASGLPYDRSEKSADQHDDAWRHAVGRCALQQRRVSVQDSTFWRKLRRRWAAAAPHDVPSSHAQEIEKKGVLPYLDPLQRWEISQPGNVLRVFERGGRKKSEIGNPDLEEDPGKPEIKLSERGFGTGLRTDPVFLGLQKTRLLDPLLSFPGTNDQPGDYRASGCSACHVVYANDRSPEHAGVFASYGNLGHSVTLDPTIPHDESGHPIRHQFTRSIPSSQCMVCHIHPGTNMVATYFGYTWWDNEMDGEHLWPATTEPPRCRAEKRDRSA